MGNRAKASKDKGKDKGKGMWARLAAMMLRENKLVMGTAMALQRVTPGLTEKKALALVLEAVMVTRAAKAQARGKGRAAASNRRKAKRTAKATRRRAGTRTR